MGWSFWKTAKIFINAVSKIFWQFFAKCFNVSYVWILLFLFLFCSEGWIFVLDGLSYFLCLECWTMKCICFSWFFLVWFLTSKNRELVFFFCYGVPYIVSIFWHSSLYLSSFVLAPIYIYIYICYLDFFQLLKNEWFQLFLRFSSFFQFAIDFIVFKASTEIIESLLASLGFAHLPNISLLFIAIFPGLSIVFKQFLANRNFILLLMSFLWLI